MVKIACDRKGTHSLQAIVSLISREVEEKLIKETLEGHVLDLALVIEHFCDDYIKVLGCSRNPFDSEDYCCYLSSKRRIHL